MRRLLLLLFVAFLVVPYSAKADVAELISEGKISAIKNINEKDANGWTP